jgi:hypothetical protein
VAYSNGAYTATYMAAITFLFVLRPSITGKARLGRAFLFSRWRLTAGLLDKARPSRSSRNPPFLCAFDPLAIHVGTAMAVAGGTRVGGGSRA